MTTTEGTMNQTTCGDRWHLIGATRAQPVCLSCHPAVTTATAVTDEAVQAALDVANDDGHNGIDCKPDRNFAVTMRAALEAAVPHLQVQGDDGLRAALEKLAAKNANEAGTSSYRSQSRELQDLLAAHPAAPIPVQVDREALARIIHAEIAGYGITPSTAEPAAVAAVLALLSPEETK